MDWKMPWVHPSPIASHRLRRERVAWHERVHPRWRPGFRTYFVNNRGDEQMGNLGTTSISRRSDARKSGRIRPGYPQTPPYKWWNWHDEYQNTESSQ